MNSDPEFNQEKADFEKLLASKRIIKIQKNEIETYRNKKSFQFLKSWKQTIIRLENYFKFLTINWAVF